METNKKSLPITIVATYIGHTDKYCQIKNICNYKFDPSQN